MIPDEERQVDDGFKFVFYVSFPREKEVLGHDLSLGLKRITEAAGLKNFEYYTRLSVENPHVRWNKKYIDDALSRH